MRCRLRIGFIYTKNLLEAIKKALNKEIPATITIPHAGEDSCKKSLLMWITFQIIQKKTLSNDMSDPGIFKGRLQLPRNSKKNGCWKKYNC